jgi:hypothetical protein
MKKKESGIICNLDNIPVVDVNNGAFLLDFDDAQKEMLLRTLDKGESIRGFAYTGLPAPYMEMIVNTIIDNPFRSRTYPISDLDLWKIVHTGYDEEQFQQALDGLTLHLNLSDELEDVASYAASFLKFAVDGKRYGLDICSEIKNGATYNEVRDKVAAAAAEYKKKEEKKDKLNDFIFS